MATSNLEILVGLRDQASGPLSGLRRMLSGIGTVAGGILGAQAIGGLINGIKSLAREGLDAVASYERLSASMEALVARELRAKDSTLDMADALAQAGPQAKELLNWITQLAIKSPFDQEGVALALKTGLAYGFTIEQAKKLTKTTIDFTSATGGTAAQMNQIALALGQMQAKGKVSGQELLQLINAGVGTTAILKKMGFSLKDVEKGLVSSDAFFEAFIKTMDEDFGGAAERQSETWTGLLNTLEDVKKIGLREFFSGIFEAVKPLVVQLATWLQGPGLEQVKMWGQRVGELARGFVNLLSTLQAGGLRGIINSIFGEGTIARLQGFAASLKPIWDAVQNLGSAFKSSGPAIREEIGKIGSTLKNILGTQGPQIIENFVEIINSLAELWRQHGDEIIKLVSGLIQGISVILIGGLQLISGIVSGILKALTGDWRGAWDTIKKSTETFADGIARLMGTTLAQVRKTWESNLNMLVTIVRALYGKMVEAGGRIVSGLKSGISNQWNGLVSWLRSKIAALVAMVQNALKIKSPSGVFADIGAQMMAGMAQGIKGALDVPRMALANTNQGMVGAGGGVAAGGTYIGRVNIVIPDVSDPYEAADIAIRKLQRMGGGAGSLRFAG